MAAAYGEGALKDVLQQHHKRLNVVLGLLAAWLIVQYLPLVYP